jgi:hypothetical protein
MEKEKIFPLKNDNRGREMEDEKMARMSNNYFLHVLRNGGENCI